MRRKCGHRAGAVAIGLCMGWTAASAPAAIVYDDRPLVMSTPTIPPPPKGDPGLPSGPIEPPSVTEVLPQPGIISGPAPLTPGKAVPLPLPAVAHPKAAAAASSGRPLKLPPSNEPEVGPIGQVVEVPPVPEPSTGVLLCVIGLAAMARRNRRVPSAPPRV